MGNCPMNYGAHCTITKGDFRLMFMFGLDVCLRPDFIHPRGLFQNVLPIRRWIQRSESANIANSLDGELV